MMWTQSNITIDKMVFNMVSKVTYLENIHVSLGLKAIYSLRFWTSVYKTKKHTELEIIDDYCTTYYKHTFDMHK